MENRLQSAGAGAANVFHQAGLNGVGKNERVRQADVDLRHARSEVAGRDATNSLTRQGREMTELDARTPWGGMAAASPAVNNRFAHRDQSIYEREVDGLQAGSASRSASPRTRQL